MRRYVVGFVLPALLLVFPARLPAQRSAPNIEAARTFSVVGTLRYTSSNQAAEMIKVELRRFTGEMVSTAFTGSNGEFQFSGLPRGSYYVVVEESGYEPIRESVEIIRGDRRGLVLYLRKPVTLVSVAATISARELTLPPKAREAFQKGMQRLYEKKDPEGSIAQFQRAIEQLPGYYEAYYQIGMADWQLDRTAEAEQAFRKSIELSASAFADPHFSLAALLCNRQKFEEAEALARGGLAIDPNSWQGHYHLARALLGLNRLAEAEKSIVAAKKRKPDYAELNLVSANIHIRAKDYTALLKDLDEYLRLAPDGPMSQAVRETLAHLQKQRVSAGDKPVPSPPKP